MHGKCANEFEEPACCALKHNTPCGVAIGKDAYEAYMKAYEVIQLQYLVELLPLIEKLIRRLQKKWLKYFLEVIAAPDYDEDALEVLKTKKNLRVIKCNNNPKDR